MFRQSSLTSARPLTWSLSSILKMIAPPLIGKGPDGLQEVIGDRFPELCYAGLDHSLNTLSPFIGFNLRESKRKNNRKNLRLLLRLISRVFLWIDSFFKQKSKSRSRNFRISSVWKDRIFADIEAAFNHNLNDLLRFSFSFHLHQNLIYPLTTTCFSCFLSWPSS